MNFWSFAAAHPVSACIMGLGAGASAVGVSYFFAINKTPVIGSISPSFNMAIGGVEGNSLSEKDDKVISEDNVNQKTITGSNNSSK